MDSSGKQYGDATLQGIDKVAKDWTMKIADDSWKVFKNSKGQWVTRANHRLCTKECVIGLTDLIEDGIIESVM